MNLNETKMLLKEISSVDNRKLDESLAVAWQAIIGHLEFEMAKSALILARQDSTINYLEPRHIVAWAKEAKHRATRNTPEGPKDFQTSPEPLCIHDIKIMSCNACCKALAAKADELSMFDTPNPENGFTDFMFKSEKILHAWAKENVYS
tara:strand:+ start:74 stop:520 length:447 start_codon:yes stop_codon:yes gene_type:complete